METYRRSICNNANITWTLCQATSYYYGWMDTGPDPEIIIIKTWILGLEQDGINKLPHNMMKLCLHKVIVLAIKDLCKQILEGRHAHKLLEWPEICIESLIELGSGNNTFLLYNIHAYNYLLIVIINSSISIYSNDQNLRKLITCVTQSTPKLQ